MISTFSTLRARLTLNNINVNDTKQAISIDFHKENIDLQNKMFKVLCELDDESKNYTDEEFVGYIEQLNQLVEDKTMIVVCLNTKDAENDDINDAREDLHEKIIESDFEHVDTYFFEA